MILIDIKKKQSKIFLYKSIKEKIVKADQLWTILMAFYVKGFDFVLNEINNLLIKSSSVFVTFVIIICSLLSLVMVILSLFITLVFSNRISSKIIKIENVMNKVSKKDFTVKINIPGKDELNSLENNKKSLNIQNGIKANCRFYE